MAGIMHKIDDTVNNGGKKDERKGETQGGYNQQDHRGGAQGQHKEGFVDQMKDKIPGGGGGVHKGETQGGYNQQGGGNQQDHKGGGAQGERKEGFVDKIKDKIPGGGGGSGVRGVEEVEVLSTSVADYH
ncbi:hypothetical protein Peur_027848 [Populus x canadensis]